MGFDGLFLHFMAEEIKSFAVGAKIDKIFFPAKGQIVLLLRSKSESKRLFISVAGNAPRISFTNALPANPEQPPMLCMLFRKQLTSAVITGIEQQGMDRVLYLHMLATDELGDRVKRTLVIEIMAQYSNCILLDENGLIIDAVKRVDASKSSYRTVLPKNAYQLPPKQNKLNLAFCKPDELTERVAAYQTKSLSAAILSSVSGFSPVLSKEFAYRVTLGDPEVSTLTELNLNRLTHEFGLLKNMLDTGDCRPSYLTDENGELLEYSFMPLTLYQNAAVNQTAASLSELTDIFYAQKEKQQRARAKAEDIFKLIALLIERTAKKINLQSEELALTNNADEKRLFAELINANLYCLEKGSSVYRVTDYYHDNIELAIPVRPELSPAQNAQRYFKEYKKAQTAKRVLTQQIEAARSDLVYLYSVRDALSRAESERELTEIRTELSLGNFIKSKTGTKNKKNTPVKPLCFLVPNGMKILVGRNNMQNDEITFKKAYKSDWWFHVKGAPGAHTVLLTGGLPPSEQIMELAAQTAAYYSSVSTRGMAEVDYTQIKNLKKPPAARPGFVIYHVYQTAYVQAKPPALPTE